MTLLVCDLAEIDSQIRSIARTQLGRIFAVSGVDLAWVEVADKSKPCTIWGLSSYFTLVLVSRPPKGWTSTFDTMGLAPSRTGPYPRAYVFYELLKVPVQSFNAPDEKTALGNLLGHVIAHELGHLLMGEVHGYGVMRAQWTYDEWESVMHGGLLFDPAHEKLIHERLSSGN